MKTPSMLLKCIILAGICQVAIVNGAVADADPEPVRGLTTHGMVLELAELLKKNDPESADQKAREIINHRAYDLAEVMSGFKLRSKGGFGVGQEAQAIKPDGIEGLLLVLERKALPNEDLAKHSEALLRTAFIIAAMADVAYLDKKAIPAKDKKKQVVWEQSATVLREAANDLAKAAHAKKPDLVQSAARKLNTACTGCHQLFRGDDLPDKVIQDLNAATAVTRLEAVRLIAEYARNDRSAIPLLLEALNDRDGPVREASARFLGGLGIRPETRLSVINEATHEAPIYVRYWFAHHMREVNSDDQAVPLLARLLVNPDNRIRAKAADILGRIGMDSKDAIPALKKCLQDGDPGVSRSAELALRKIDVPDIVAQLVLRMKEGDAVERGRAAIALAKQGKTVVPAVAKLLGENDTAVRASALFALGKIGPDAKECVPLLLDLLKNDDAYLRNRAGAALKMIDPEAAAGAGVK